MLVQCFLLGRVAVGEPLRGLGVTTMVVVLLLQVIDCFSGSLSFFSLFCVCLFNTSTSF
jgi:hypothetical protein